MIPKNEFQNLIYMISEDADARSLAIDIIKNNYTLGDFEAWEMCCLIIFTTLSLPDNEYNRIPKLFDIYDDLGDKDWERNWSANESPLFIRSNHGHSIREYFNKETNPNYSKEYDDLKVYFTTYWKDKVQMLGQVMLYKLNLI